MREELWTPIPGFYPYEAHPMGKIRNCRTKKILKSEGSASGCGYERVRVTVSDRTKRTPVHRLIALTFLPRPSGDLENFVVDHIDYNVHNNNIFNLRWLPKEINRIRRRTTHPETLQKAIERFFGET